MFVCEFRGKDKKAFLQGALTTKEFFSSEEPPCGTSEKHEAGGLMNKS
jgi:hypothetical protein